MVISYRKYDFYNLLCNGGRISSWNESAYWKPISKTQVYILNENMQPVNNGTAGELYTGGDGVALGI